MKDQFATYEVSKQLRDLGYDNDPYAWYFGDKNNPILTKTIGSYYPEKEICLEAPLWQQVKQWLWEKQSVVILIKIEQRKFYSITNNLGNWRIISKEFDSPITAEMQGIKKAVEYLHKQLTKE